MKKPTSSESEVVHAHPAIDFSVVGEIASQQYFPQPIGCLRREGAGCQALIPKDVNLPRFSLLEVRCDNEAMNAALAVYVCSTNHALITQSEGVCGLGVGEGDRDETRLDLNSVVCT